MPAVSRAVRTAPSPITTRRSASIRRCALAYNNRGVSWRDSGDAARARADFQTAVAMDPALDIAREHLQQLGHAQGRTAGAGPPHLRGGDEPARRPFARITDIFGALQLAATALITYAHFIS